MEDCGIEHKPIHIAQVTDGINMHTILDAAQHDHEYTALLTAIKKDVCYCSGCQASSKTYDKADTTANLQFFKRLIGSSSHMDSPIVSMTYG